MLNLFWRITLKLSCALFPATRFNSFFFFWLSKVKRPVQMNICGCFFGFFFLMSEYFFHSWICSPGVSKFFLNFLPCMKCLIDYVFSSVFFSFFFLYCNVTGVQIPILTYVREKKCTFSCNLSLVFMQPLYSSRERRCVPKICTRSIVTYFVHTFTSTWTWGWAYLEFNVTFCHSFARDCTWQTPVHLVRLLKRTLFFVLSFSVNSRAFSRTWEFLIVSGIMSCHVISCHLSLWTHRQCLLRPM